MNTITKSIALAAAAYVGLSFTAVAHAQEAPKIEVSTIGVDLGSPTEVGQLKQRVNSAARKVCKLGENEGLVARQFKQNCYKNAVAAANTRIDAQVALHSTDNEQLARAQAVPVSKIAP